MKTLGGGGGYDDDDDTTTTGLARLLERMRDDQIMGKTPSVSGTRRSLATEDRGLVLPLPPRVDDPDDERGNNASSNATPDTKTVKARDPTKCRNGHGAHETGTARTNRVGSAHESGRERARIG